MLLLARDARGLTQKELAARLRLDPARLSRIETGDREFPSDYVAELCEVLDFPEEFFYQNETRQGMAPSEFYHRKRAALGVRDVARIHARLDLYRLAISKMLRNVEMEAVSRVPRLDVEEHDSPEEIASLLRGMWGVPRGPIPNLTRLIENAGGMVIHLDFGTRLVDAVSRWLPGMPPVIFVNRALPADRKRFTIAHELGHLVMHADPNPEMEPQAHRFASEFLSPAAEIRTDLFEISPAKLATLKSIWKISMAALLVRARALGTISERQYRYMWTRMAPYRSREPEETEFADERPSLLDDLIQVQRQEFGLGPTDLAKLTRMSTKDVVEMFFPPTEESAQLRLVQ
jgi:Zn-dependent peptidase ImmA (M78 family)/transcriptional regulator with XRE-family HTH domain